MNKFPFVYCLLALFVTPAYPAQSTITEVKGEACMRDNKSRKLTEQAALIDAKKKAVEYASTHVRSETEVRGFALEKDLLSAYSNAEVRVVQELNKGWYKDASLGECYRIRIKAEVIPDEERIKDYDLQERCSMRAEELFAKHRIDEVGNDYWRNVTGTYRNHFNKKLNKCFMIIADNRRDPNNFTYPAKFMQDTHENRVCGLYLGILMPDVKKQRTLYCDVFGKPCKSEREWDSLVAPYMEE